MVALGIAFGPMALRFRLAHWLEQTGLSQSELSRRSGVSFVTINGIANNRTTRVDLATLDSLSAALSEAIGRTIEPGELLERDAPPSSTPPAGGGGGASMSMQERTVRILDEALAAEMDREDRADTRAEQARKTNEAAVPQPHSRTPKRRS